MCFKFWILLLKENYHDTARCCYYEYHYLWQVVRLLVFFCYPIRDQGNSNWPIREKNSLCCDKCWQWGASFCATRAKYKQRSKWISAVWSDLTWTISPRYIALRQRIFQNRSRWRLTRTAPYPIGDGVAAKFSFSPRMMSPLHFLSPSPPSILNRCWQKPQLQLGVQLQRSVVSTI